MGILALATETPTLVALAVIISVVGEVVIGIVGMTVVVVAKPAVTKIAKMMAQRRIANPKLAFNFGDML